MASITPPGSPTRGLVLPDMSGFDSPRTKRSASPGWDSPRASSSNCPAAPKRPKMRAKDGSIGERIEILRTALDTQGSCAITIGAQKLQIIAQNRLGSGEYFTVYRVPGGVIKIFNEDHRQGNPIYSQEMEEALQNTKTQYLAMQNLKIPLVPILNIETMETDGVIYQQEAVPLEHRWKTILQKQELSQEDQNIVEQVKKLFQVFYKDNTIPADLAPGNLAYDKTTKTVYGLDLTHQGEEIDLKNKNAFTIILRQTLDAFAKSSPTLRAYLDPRNLS